jgi:hypothetical protein
MSLLFSEFYMSLLNIINHYRKMDVCRAFSIFVVRIFSVAVHIFHGARQKTLGKKIV